MIDYQLHEMLGRMFQHTQSMRKYQQNLKLMNTKYDRRLASMFEQQVDLDISNIEAYIRKAMSPPNSPLT